MSSETTLHSRHEPIGEGAAGPFPSLIEILRNTDLVDMMISNVLHSYPPADSH